MINIVKKFLEKRHQKELPILLAFSGGPDSLALLHLLIEARQTLPLRIAIAHVDHGWRVESKSEALKISLMAEKLDLPFYLKTLNPAEMVGNLEAACREERFQFFASLCREHGFQAVLLAHHANDLAETVLKRTLEGVSLPYLSALRPETTIYGMKVWRPLLTIPKNRILDWLHERKLQGFIDQTNSDTKYMRPKMRLQILPYLSEMFGKKISSGLCQIAGEAGELRDYLDKQISIYFSKISRKDENEYFLDLSIQCPNDLFELKYLIRQFCKKCGFPISRDCLNKAADFVLNCSIHKYFLTKKGKLHIDRRRLTVSLTRLKKVSG